MAVATAAVSTAPAAPDQAKLMQFMGKVVTDLGAGFNVALVLLGEHLGLYKAMAGAGPISSAELAKKTQTDERYVREWLSAQATGGYVTYDSKTKTFELPPEQAFALAEEDSPVYVPGAFQLVFGLLKDSPKIEAVFRSGEGVGWHEHDSDLFEGCERFFRPNYIGNLTSSWIPALEGVEAKLRNGARVADIGCGHGASTILLAKAYPKSTFVGYDYHGVSIERARQHANSAGVSDRVSFEVASAKDYPGTGFDLVAFFDCLHDMGDPAGAAAHVRRSLKSDGTWMIVEPFANDPLERITSIQSVVSTTAPLRWCAPQRRAHKK